ncbi:unnamed protein product [Malassezia sympodialis ATCC 42132]|uniref:uncharacterized protein n=1 Tax=Malassezia sympodialis (strain ATCC 42132) TaxID=1230383 RepID=UPI0002C2BEFD|nr:uncharacterized protein MSY001_1390 [Malassezia sympodialis ATCC 42132]CCU98684.1 unnamed protein product [Malassezia sympodialis ATCC 42132]|eukprot:XP_018739974.1 uncharacterized protein MSY001_1390 [Malassezia sympodialis ATCC 42132]
MSALSADEYSQLSRDEQGVEDQVQMERIRKEQESLPYAWGQKLDHVEMSFPVPPGTRARQVQVTLKRTYLSVLVHNNVVVEGTLYRPIQLDGSTWTIGMCCNLISDDGQMLSVYLEKENGNEWWPHVVTHHPQIDTTKLTPEDSQLSDLDGETR